MVDALSDARHHEVVSCSFYVAGGQVCSPLRSDSEALREVSECLVCQVRVRAPSPSLAFCFLTKLGGTHYDTVESGGGTELRRPSSGSPAGRLSSRASRVCQQRRCFGANRKAGQLHTKQPTKS